MEPMLPPTGIVGVAVKPLMSPVGPSSWPAQLVIDAFVAGAGESPVTVPAVVTTHWGTSSTSGRPSARPRHHGHSHGAGARAGVRDRERRRAREARSAVRDGDRLDIFADRRGDDQARPAYCHVLPTIVEVGPRGPTWQCDVRDSRPGVASAVREGASGQWSDSRHHVRHDLNPDPCLLAERAARDRGRKTGRVAAARASDRVSDQTRRQDRSTKR